MYAAETECDPNRHLEAKAGASSDMEQARRILHELGARRDLKPWIFKARQFVRKNWNAIDMVARDLIETKTLDDTEVSEIVRIADGETDAPAGLARYRLLIGRKGTKQFPFTVAPE
jgi:hypothetical protein